jgi:preprotein translocase subunit SecG
MALDRIVSLVLRAAELAFAAIVAGINGEFLHKSNADSWALGRNIYTEVVAALAIFFALIWLVPFSATFTHWPLDILISILWWVAFGLLVDDLEKTTCGGVFAWGNVSFRGDPCGKAKAVVAFTFLSAVLWLVSAIVGFFWLRRRERTVARAEAAHSRRHRWYRRSHV